MTRLPDCNRWRHGRLRDRFGASLFRNRATRQEEAALFAWLDLPNGTPPAGGTGEVAAETRSLLTDEPVQLDDARKARIWEKVMMNGTIVDARRVGRDRWTAGRADSRANPVRIRCLLLPKHMKWAPVVNGVATLVLLFALAAGFLSFQRRATTVQPTQMAYALGTPIAREYGGCAATPFTHELPPPVAQRTDRGKADWISGDGMMVGLRRDYLREWIEGTDSVFFWSKEGGRIDATATRIDVPSDKSIVLEQFAMAPNDVAGAMWSFPTPGCWDVAVTIGSRSLRFTAKVMPEDQHAGKKAAIARREANTPGPIPANCPVSTWDGPRRTGQGADYQFYVDGNGVALQSSDTIYAVGENDLRWLTRSDQEFTLTGVRLDAPGTIEDVVPYRMVPGEGYPDYWMTSLTFPHAGCWQLTATAGDTRLTATIYVFPKRKNPLA